MDVSVSQREVMNRPPPANEDNGCGKLRLDFCRRTERIDVTQDVSSVESNKVDVNDDWEQVILMTSCITNGIGSSKSGYATIL